MKKVLSIIIVCIVALSMFTGCDSKPKEGSTTGGQKSSLSGETLKVGTMPMTIGVPVQYALEKGYFKELGLDVKMIIFPTGAPINEAIAAKQLDMAVSGMASVFPLAIGEYTWIGDGANNVGGLGIYVRKDSPILKTKGQIKDKPNMYGSADTIKGMTALGPLGTSAQYNVIKYVEQFGLKETDVKMVSMEYAASYQAFKTGQGDSIASTPPFSYNLESEGFICAATFGDATGMVLHDGLFVRNDILSKKRADIVAFVKGYYRASEELSKDKKLRSEYSIKWFESQGLKYTAEAMAKELVSREYVNKEYMSKPTYELGRSMVDIGKFNAQIGKIEAANLPNVAKAINNSILKEALGIDVKVAK